MRIVKAGYEIMFPKFQRPYVVEEANELLEAAGRVSYKSESAITPESAGEFIRRRIAEEHGAVLEHTVMTVRFTVDRGVSHELVRHRLASFTQESTRYCNYSKGKFGHEITVIKPCFWAEDSELYRKWKAACELAEGAYFALLEGGATPEKARSVLPNSLKTEVVMTANAREWRHIFKLRAAGTTGKPHPQMLEVMVPLLNEVKGYMPDLFGDIEGMEL